MSIKDQLKKLKENWLVVLVVVVLLLLPTFGGSLYGPVYGASEMAFAEKGIAASSRYGGYSYPGQDSFAPEETDRLITKSGSLTTEVKRGNFLEADAQLKSIVTAMDAYLLTQNVNKYDSEWQSYHQGSYQIKVEAKKYDALVSQLKQIGEVTVFSENVDDITGTSKNLRLELEAEKARLERYQQMLKEAQTVQEKLELSDRIFNQERTVKYLQDAVKNVGQQVEYSTIHVTITEKQSGYAGIALVKFSTLIRSLVDSLNGLLQLVFVLLPYGVAVGIVWAAVRWAKKRK